MLVIINLLTQTDAQRISEHMHTFGVLFGIAYFRILPRKTAMRKRTNKTPVVTIKLVDNEHCVHKNG